tara:strand:- start:430 stop:663 length:234 start_codon:yes stop_codon:yes gene_type:complete
MNWKILRDILIVLSIAGPIGAFFWSQTNNIAAEASLETFNHRFDDRVGPVKDDLEQILENQKEISYDVKEIHKSIKI